MDCMRNQLYDGVVLNGRYQTISPLNHGSFGLVFQARDLVTDELVAIKVITKTNAADHCPSGLAVDERSEELDIHLRIRSHSNVVNLLESFETQNHVYLILEFCSNGDLYEAIRLGKGPLETEHVRDFMLQLVGAVEFLHAKGIYHRDIKPENIFLAQDGTMKLGDFGLATTDDWSYEIAVGSDRYMAPEQYDPPSSGYATDKADIWAIGICLLNVLFSRNPFAVPNISDPLYADFALDRQTLFDVFPNLSQDTYEVLRHCLAIDPERRDLSSVKAALMRAISFTTDDESLDDFCTEERETIMASANREPLRTPSISTPQLDQGGSFPWAKALAMSPPPVRQLSVIPDTEIYSDDMYPESVRSGHQWFDAKPDNVSTVSFVDSGLGLSFKSTGLGEPFLNARSRPMPIAGSLPANAARPFNSMASVFGQKRDVVSKSWSDLWDEEEEEEQAIAEIENDYTPFSNLKKEDKMSESGSGVSTPRGGLAELKNPAMVNNSRSRSPNDRRAAEHVSQHTGFVFEEHASPSSKYSPPSKRTTADKWAALGDRRRGQQPQTPQKSERLTKSPRPPVSPNSARKRSRTGSWRRPVHCSPTHPENHGVGERKDNWNMSKDWRQHPNRSFEDDIGDLEWVGGWNDLHL
jgi:serine/threonine protein kinase